MKYDLNLSTFPQESHPFVRQHRFCKPILISKIDLLNGHAKLKYCHSGLPWAYCQRHDITESDETVWIPFWRVYRVAIYCHVFYFEKAFYQALWWQDCFSCSLVFDEKIRKNNCSKLLILSLSILSFLLLPIHSKLSPHVMLEWGCFYRGICIKSKKVCNHLMFKSIFHCYLYRSEFNGSTSGAYRLLRCPPD